MSIFQFLKSFGVFFLAKTVQQSSVDYLDQVVKSIDQSPDLNSRPDIVRTFLKQVNKEKQELSGFTSNLGKIVGKINNNIEGVILKSALSTAIKFDDENEVKRLLDEGADAKAIVEHKTLLAQAVEKGNKYIVEHLLSKGADPREISTTSTYYQDEETRMVTYLSWYDALDFAIVSNRPQIANLLLQHMEIFSNDTYLVSAAYWGREEIVSQLIEAKANANIVGKTYASWNGRQGGAPLEIAIEKNNTAITTMLLNGGDANPNTRGDIGFPLEKELSYYLKKAQIRMKK